MVIQAAKIVAVPAFTSFALRETSFFQTLPTSFILVPLLTALAMHLLVELFPDLTKVVRHQEGGRVKRDRVLIGIIIQ